MNDLQIFSNSEFGNIRTVTVNGEPWFVGKDIAEALGYGKGKSLNNAVASHVDVVAYYGEAGFSTTGKLTTAVTKNDTTYAAGTIVQVMVEQPKFYYKVVPLKTEKRTKGAITRKIRYYVSDTPKAGFKLHPAFIVNGQENDVAYLAAFEGTLWDASAGAYIMNIIAVRYMNMCNENRVNFMVDIRSNTLTRFNDTDITTLFCNLLDNAYEAAKTSRTLYDSRVDKEDDPEWDASYAAFISLEIKPFHNDNRKTLIKLVNSCAYNPFSSGGKLYTTKPDKRFHGYGVRSIHRIVDYYHGDMEQYYEETRKEFHTVILV